MSLASEVVANAAGSEEHKTIFSCMNEEGYTIYVTNIPSVMISTPYTNIEFEFNRENWEEFGYKVSDTENYTAVKKSDFVEFFQAMKFVRSYESHSLEQTQRQIEKVIDEMAKKQESIKAMDEIIAKYEEVYNENKIQ